LLVTPWIKDHLANEKEDRDPRRIGLSASGHCARQLAFKYHGVQGAPLSWRSRSIFSDGNFIQDQLRTWIHLADKPECYYLADEEAEVTLKTPMGREIIGHVDGVIHHRKELLGVPYCQDTSHATRLLEIKSMSSTGFRMLHREGLEKSYQTQVSCYLKALNLEEAIVICKCKDTSELAELVIKRDDQLVADALARYDTVVDSKYPSMVERMYGPKEDGSLPWNCGYCPFWAECWKDFKPVEKLAHKVVLMGDYKENL
jgi:hypothetical protein